ncbi:MAG: GSCFA domain-containing protein [Paludibacteraceae bacterium]|nr:GSCFA domain-containing protein [Paludibacteraceae bacterium]
MKLQTIVDIKPSEWQIGYEDRILMLGSCFADEMGEQMRRRGLHVTSNPFGTLYNPLSIAQAINLQISESSNLPMINHDGLWHSMAHHGAFSRPNKEDAEQAVRGSIETMQNALAEATVVIVTFGSAWVYEMEGHIVANCHKMPESCFSRRRLSVDEIVEAWRPIVDRYPDIHWLFTVSPIRHIRDGLHENQLSKATLLMAVEQLASLGGRSSGVSYFPSYEIVLDELRDYRFYADDLVHPSALAVNYIWERFTEVYCTPQTRNQMQIEFKRWKQDRHIPLH